MGGDRPRLYVIETARCTGGDSAGYLMDADGEVLHSHMSSSLSWLVSDLTKNFGRAESLAEAYPEHEVVVVSGDDSIPDEIARHFDSAPEGVQP
jgi:hypothetical protein